MLWENVLGPAINVNLTSTIYLNCCRTNTQLLMQSVFPNGQIIHKTQHTNQMDQQLPENHVRYWLCDILHAAQSRCAGEAG